MKRAQFVRATRLAVSAAGLMVVLVSLTACDIAGSAREETAFFEERSPGIHTVVISDGLVTLQAKNASVQSIVDELARKSELSVVCDFRTEARVTMELERLPMPDALRRILGERSFILYRAPAAAGTGSRNGNTLCVFSDDSGNGFAATRAPSYILSAIENRQSELMSDDRHVRRRAVRALRRLKAGDVVPALSYALADTDESIRVEAIYAIADVGGDDAVAALAAALVDQSARVRSETAAALGTLGSDAAFYALQRALRDADSSVRASAISALGLMGGEQSAAALAIALSDPDASLRIDAVATLAEIGGESSIALLNQASRQGDPAVRKAVAEALSDLHDQYP